MQAIFKAAAFLMLFVSCAISAQVTPNDSITLAQAVSATLERHPQLRSFPLRSEALQGELENANLDPALRIRAGLEEFAGTGVMQDFANTEASISLSQVIELGDKRSARVGVARRRIDLLDAQQRVTELDLIAQVVTRFIDAASAQALVELHSKATEIARQTVSLLQPLVDAGRTPDLELKRAQAALIRSQHAQEAAQASQEATYIRLSMMWAESVPSFNQVDIELLNVGNAGDINTLLETLSTSPDMDIFASESRLRESELTQAESLQAIDIEWSAGVKHLREYSDTGFTFDVVVGLGSKQRASGAIRSAHAALEEVEARHETALNKMTAELTASHRVLQQAISQTNSLRTEVIPLLDAVMVQTNQAYENGTYNYLQLINSQQEFLDAQLALINSATSAHKLRAEIERLSGQALTSRQ